MIQIAVYLFLGVLVITFFEYNVLERRLNTWLWIPAVVFWLPGFVCFALYGMFWVLSQ